jgi:hypothetical protein
MGGEVIGRDEELAYRSKQSTRDTKHSQSPSDRVTHE